MWSGCSSNASWVFIQTIHWQTCVRWCALTAADFKSVSSCAWYIRCKANACADLLPLQIVVARLLDFKYSRSLGGATNRTYEAPNTSFLVGKGRTHRPSKTQAGTEGLKSVLPSMVAICGMEHVCAHAPGSWPCLSLPLPRWHHCKSLGALLPMDEVREDYECVIKRRKGVKHGSIIPAIEIELCSDSSSIESKIETYAIYCITEFGQRRTLECWFTRNPFGCHPTTIQSLTVSTWIAGTSSNIFVTCWSLFRLTRAWFSSDVLTKWGNPHGNFGANQQSKYATWALSALYDCHLRLPFWCSNIQSACGRMIPHVNPARFAVASLPSVPDCGQRVHDCLARVAR